MEKELFTTKEAAEYLKIHIITLRRYLETGRLKGYKVGPRWRIKLEDVQDFLKGNK